MYDMTIETDSGSLGEWEDSITNERDSLVGGVVGGGRGGGGGWIDRCRCRQARAMRIAGFFFFFSSCMEESGGGGVGCMKRSVGRGGGV